MSRSQEFITGFSRTPLHQGEPFPDLKGHHAALNGGISSAGTRPVRVDSLHAGSQVGYFPRQVGRYVARPGLKSRHDLATSQDTPLFVRNQGKTFVADGHHRVLAAAARGEEEVQAKVYDMQRRRYL